MAESKMVPVDKTDEYDRLFGQYKQMELAFLTREPREGLKNDKDKVRLDLIPPEAVFALGEILTFGSKKYTDRNWELGMSWGRVFGALMRHCWAWWGGKGPTTKSFLFGEVDDETAKSHLWHALCCLVFLVTYEERSVGTDDRMRGNRTIDQSNSDNHGSDDDALRAADRESDKERYDRHRFMLKRSN